MHVKDRALIGSSAWLSMYTMVIFEDPRRVTVAMDKGLVPLGRLLGLDVRGTEKRKRERKKYPPALIVIQRHLLHVPVTVPVPVLKP